MRYRLTDPIRERMNKLHAEGATPAQLSATLKNEYGIPMSSASVEQLLRRQRNKYKDVAEQVVIEEVRAHIRSDLDILTEERDRLVQVVLRLFAAVMSDPEINHRDVSSYLQSSQRLREVLQTRLKYTGLSEHEYVKAATTDELRELVERAVQVLQ
jgi:hypothetical protein